MALGPSGLLEVGAALGRDAGTTPPPSLASQRLGGKGAHLSVGAEASAAWLSTAAGGF